MVLFDGKGKLRKYESVYDILDNFCQVRYKYYILRKKRQLSDLDLQVKMLGNKRRFLEEIRDGEIELFKVINKKKQSKSMEELTFILVERGYDKLIKENGSEEEEKDGKGYEYLLRLQIGNITAEKIDKLKKDLESAVKDREELRNISEKDIWLRELDAFQEEYDSYLIELENENRINRNEDQPKKGKSRKRKE